MAIAIEGPSHLGKPSYTWNVLLEVDPEMMDRVIGEASGVVVGETLQAAHIVYSRSQMLLDRQKYGSWRDVQDTYDDYVTSLGPWSEADIVGFFEDDCGADDSQWPFTRQAIADFFRSGDLVLVCAEAKPGAEL